MIVRVVNNVQEVIMTSTHAETYRIDLFQGCNEGIKLFAGEFDRHRLGLTLFVDV